MNRRIFSLLLVVFSGLGCEDNEHALDPAWGKQACASCTMLVSDKRYAAELVTGRGERLFFDDPGCLAAYLINHGERVRTSWVRAEDGRWLSPESARYDAGAKTPMDYGFVVSAQGHLDWSSVLAAARARNEGGHS